MQPITKCTLVILVGHIFRLHCSRWLLNSPLASGTGRLLKTLPGDSTLDSEGCSSRTRSNLDWEEERKRGRMRRRRRKRRRRRTLPDDGCFCSDA